MFWTQIVNLRMNWNRSKHVVLYNKWDLFVFGRILTVIVIRPLSLCRSRCPVWSTTFVISTVFFTFALPHMKYKTLSPGNRLDHPDLQRVPAHADHDARRVPHAGWGRHPAVPHHEAAGVASYHQHGAVSRQTGAGSHGRQSASSG